MEHVSRAFPILVFLLVGGCASSSWEKPGADAATQDADLQACRQNGRALAARDPSLNTLVRPSPSESGSLSMQSSPEIDSERQLREFQATQRCMRQKGYELKPAAAR